MNPFQFSRLSTSALIDQLKSVEKEELQLAIIIELVMRNDRDAIEAVVELLDNNSQVVQITALWALGEFGDPAAIQPLIDYLMLEVNDLVLMGIGEALRKIGNQSIKPLIAAMAKASEPQSITLGETLAGIGTYIAYREAMESASSEIESLRISAALALGNFGAPDSIDTLIKLTEDQSISVIEHAADALRFAEDHAGAGDALMALLPVDNVSMLEVTIGSLSMIREKRAYEHLIPYLKHDDPVIVSATIAALAELSSDSEETSILVRPFLSHESAEVRLAAAVILAELGDLASVPAIIERITLEEEPDVLDETIIALAGMNDNRVLPALLDASIDSQHSNSMMTARLIAGDDDAYRHYLTMIRSSDTQKRVEACHTFHASNNKQATMPLIGALVDSEWEVRSAAAGALGKLKSKEAIRPLSDLLLKDEVINPRQSAAGALGQIGDVAAISALIRGLQYDDSEVVRGESALALGQIKDTKAMKPLIIACLDVSERVRAAAAQALGDLKDPAAISALKTMLKDEFMDPRIAAQLALKTIASA